MSDPTLAEFRVALANIFDLVDIARNGESLDDETFDKIEEAAGLLAERLCDVFGHKAVKDQCGRPEHDFCVLCRAITPGQAASRTQV